MSARWERRGNWTPAQNGRRPPPPARSLSLLFCVEKSRGCGQSTFWNNISFKPNCRYSSLRRRLSNIYFSLRAKFSSRSIFESREAANESILIIDSFCHPFGIHPAGNTYIFRLNFPWLAFLKYDFDFCVVEMELYLSYVWLIQVDMCKENKWIPRNISTLKSRSCEPMQEWTLAIARGCYHKFRLFKDKESENWYPFKGPKPKNDTLFKGRRSVLWRPK